VLAYWGKLSLENAFNKLDDQGKDEAKNNHRCNRKVELEIVILHADVAGQAAYPMQFIGKEIQYQPSKYNQDAQGNEPFTSFGVHQSNLWLTRLKHIGRVKINL